MDMVIVPAELLGFLISEGVENDERFLLLLAFTFALIRAVLSLNG